MKPLEGVKILDFTHAYSAVYTGQLFADMGAEVIKIEPMGGEQSRQWPPFSRDYENRSCYYGTFNRNRTAISVNLKKEEGKEIIYELVKDADILLVNMRNGAMDKLGLGYEDLKKINPKLIYSTLNGYGSKGPFSPLKAYDNICTAYSGIMYSTGREEQPPQKLGISIGDNYSGLTMLSTVLTALIYQRKTGQGQLVEVAMQDSLFGLVDKQILEYSMTGEVPKRKGNAHTMYAPEDVFVAAGDDNYVALSIHSEEQWKKFCEILNKPEWMTNPRFVDNKTRRENYNELRPLIAEIFEQMEKFEIQNLLLPEGVPCTATTRISDILAQPQFTERNVIRYQTDFQVGSLLTSGNPIKFGDTCCEEILSSKFPGEDNEDVLSEIGYSKDRIEKLYAKEVLFKYDR
jgi:CoA:oxalate CoA-transferase